MDRSKYEKIFVQESERYLNELDDLLLRVEKNPKNRELWGEIHGKIHSIKGMARALSLGKITTLSHLMEEWCKLFQQGATTSTPSAIQAIFDGASLLGHLVARKGEIESFENQKWYSTLIARFEKRPETAVQEDDLKKPPAKAIRAEVRSISEVRVRYSLIEELLGLAQEIQLLGKTLPPIPQEQLTAGLKNWLDHYTSLMKVLHFRLAHLRLMPVGDFADLFTKTIRNLAREYGKKVRLEVKGGEIQADITLLERLREPLVHLFRNCIAHGIESPDERKKVGKDAEGRILIEASRKKESLFVKISDDGRGIDRASIVRYLRDKRSMTDEDIENMPEKELLGTILSPDYSSISKATDLAGRGIGMSVVAQAIEYLGGSMNITTTPSKGTEFFIRLPLSLSIVYAITFKLGRYTLSVPTSQVESIDRVANLSAEEYSQVYPLKHVMGVGEDQKIFFNVIKLKPTEDHKNGIPKEGLVGLAVDGILGNRPLMVLPVGELLAKAGLYSGVGIMENGDISMLLDIEKLPGLSNRHGFG